MSQPFSSVSRFSFLVSRINPRMRFRLQLPENFVEKPTTRNEKRSLRRCRRLHLLGSLQNFINAALHVEGLLGDVIVLTVDDLLEAAHGVRDLHVASLDAGELFGDVERLREELLD